jgi:hypothetical protein
MNPTFGVLLVLGVAALAAWAVWKWRNLFEVSPDGESSDPAAGRRRLRRRVTRLLDESPPTIVGGL